MIEYSSANNDGEQHYALLMRPNGWQDNVSYPVLQYVYAGPGVQLIQKVWNTYVVIIVMYSNFFFSR